MSYKYAMNYIFHILNLSTTITLNLKNSTTIIYLLNMIISIQFNLSSGFAIEPIRSYLNDLPNRTFIHKVNVAISNGSYPKFLLNETAHRQLQMDTHKGTEHYSSVNSTQSNYLYLYSF